MTKQELLTRLAKECATWEESISILDNIACSYWVRGIPYGITMSDWLAERERLLNKPQWRYAPRNACALVFDDFTKQWEWCYSTPALFKMASGGETWLKTDYTLFASEAIAIPAGYDWRESLEERPA